MIEIRTAAEALTTAQWLLDANTSAGGAEGRQSCAASPLAAVLRSTAHANAGFADLAAALDAPAEPTSEPDGPSHSGSVSIAQRWPDALLSGALHRAAGVESRQRDSVGMSALAALARS